MPIWLNVQLCYKQGLINLCYMVWTHQLALVFGQPASNLRFTSPIALLTLCQKWSLVADISNDLCSCSRPAGTTRPLGHPLGLGRTPQRQIICLQWAISSLENYQSGYLPGQWLVGRNNRYVLFYSRVLHFGSRI